MSKTRRGSAALVCLFALLMLLPAAASAKYFGATARLQCACCNSCAAGQGTTCPTTGCASYETCTSRTCISRTEGNLSDTRPGVGLRSVSGAPPAFALRYDSYNADTSRARIGTILGNGWTHAYNIYLYSVRGHMFRVDAEGRITKYKLGPGGTYTAAAGYFETLVRNPDGSFTLTQKDKTVYRFAATPVTDFLPGTPVYQLTSITDRNNNTVTLAYAGSLLTTVTDTYGRKLAFTYNAQRRLASVTDPLGRATTFSYDASGAQLLAVTDPLGHSTRYSYNFLFQITARTDRDGRVFSYGYQNNLPVSVTDGASGTLFTLSNPVNWAVDDTVLAQDMVRKYAPATTSKTDGRGNVWQYQYDANGYIVRMTAPDGATTSFTYDPVTLMPASETDANGHTTRFEYDIQGNLTKRTDARGNVTLYTYEPVFSQMTSMRDANGRVTTYEYDARGNRTKETDPLTGVLRWTYDSHGNVLTETDKNGNVTAYTYDAFGNRATMVDAVGNTTTMTYDVVGNMLTRTNPRSFLTRYENDALDRLVKETDALGKVTQIAYDNEGNRTQIIDRNGNATDYQYDQRQRLTMITDALGQSMSYTYDGNDNRVSATDKNGHATRFDYDVQNRLAEVTDAIGNIISMTYDPVGNKLTETDANGHTTVYQYDELDRLAKKTDAELNVTQMLYDMVGLAGCPTCTGPTKGSSLVTELIDAEGKVTYFEYDGLDRLIIQIRKQTDTADSIDGDDAVTRYSYDAQNNRLTVVEPNGNTTTYAYDTLNRQVKVVNAAGDTRLTTYDPNSNVKTVTTPNLNVATNTYDALDRLIQVDDSVGRVASHTYDNVGNRLTQKDGNSNGTISTYDRIYRITEVTDALGKIMHYDYDPVGNLLKVTDREGRVTTYLYDDINRRIQVTDAQPFVTRYEYDGVGNLKKILAFNDTEDAADPPQVTSYDYDNIDRLIKEAYPDSRSRSFTYDRVSNLRTRTDQKAQTTTYSYSDLYFLTRRDYPVSADDTMSYDLSGRMLTAERGGWLVTFAYDGANRVTNTVQNGKTLAYSYDVPGRKRTVTYPGGRSIVEATDARSRLGRIDDPASTSPIVQYSYDLGNRIVSRVYRNRTAARYAYNANNWITSLNHVKSDLTPIAGFAHDYDNEGNKRFESKLHEPSASEAYHYDSIYRLIDFKVGSLVGSTVPVPTTQTQYTLDNVGNWKLKTKDAIPETRTHNAVNEITSINGAPVLSDLNGNTSDDRRYAYSYDEENRLTVVTRKADGRMVGQYRYDALSRRVTKVADAATPSIPVETRFFYDNARIVEEQSPSVTTQATYVYGNYIDEVLTMDRAAQTYYYHPNSLWSVAAITNATAAVVERYAYDAYGLPTVTDGSGPPGATLPPNAWGTPHSAIGNPWIFTGRQLDEETGLYFYRARYYDPIKGRFLQRDPLEYGAGDMNLYRYVRSSPTRLLDPSGLVDCCGVDITSNLENGLRVLDGKFDELTEERKKTLCSRLLLSPYMMLRAWDISTLINDEPKTKLTKGSCGAGDCANSVTVKNTCQWAPAVNYILFGRAARLCKDANLTVRASSVWSLWLVETRSPMFPPNFDFESIQKLIANYRNAKGMKDGGGTTDQIDWARVGWTGDWKHMPGTASAYRNCAPCKLTLKKPTAVFVGESLQWNLGRETDKEKPSIIEFQDTDKVPMPGMLGDFGKRDVY